MIRFLFTLMSVILLAAGCGGRSPQPLSVDRPEATVGVLQLAGSPDGTAALSEDDLLARHRNRETLLLAGENAEQVGVTKRDGSAGLALVPDMVIMTGLETEGDFLDLLSRARTARVRWALGVPEGTTVTVQPEFGDVTCSEGAVPALIVDLDRARWGRGGQVVREARLTRLTRGAVFSLELGHVVFAPLRGEDAPDETVLEQALFGDLFKALLARPTNPVVERSGDVAGSMWVLTLDRRTLLLPAPGGMAFSNALIERRLNQD
jgi:hypothetical protein